uniref:Uncharacterized protein n=1 Tax=Anguilla anguilla TaxID=7936 RepID=A0A0E9TWZ1_ANGAN
MKLIGQNMDLYSCHMYSQSHYLNKPSISTGLGGTGGSVDMCSANQQRVRQGVTVM